MCMYSKIVVLKLCTWHYKLTHSHNHHSHHTHSHISQDIGAERGRYYAVNFPLRDGVDDESYEMIFKPVMAKVFLILIL